jgi:hypothetical protein
MGVVLAFETRARKRTLARQGAANELNTVDAELALIAAVRDRRDRRCIMAAARPLLERCRVRYGFTVMRAGLPRTTEVFARALLTLARGLRPLDAELCGGRPFWAYGVYFSEQQELAWFQDGYGSASGLAVPIGIDAAELTRFVQQRIQPLRR